MMRSFGTLVAGTREAVRSLLRARLRTLLGLVGITIGIASVITMISAGEIATAEARRKFEALGTDILSVHASRDAKGAWIPLAAAVEFAEAAPEILTAAPVLRASGTILHAGKRVGGNTVQGVTAPFAGLNKLEVAAGRFISDLDADRFWCVVGARIADGMRRRGTREIIGATIDVNDRIFTVIGELRHAPEHYALPFHLNANRSVFVPITTARRIAPGQGIRLVVARSMPGVHHEDAGRATEAWFRQRAPGVKLEVKSAKQLIEQMESQLGVMTLLLGAVGSISLVVGGIGVMNIMLISVAERRREIGVRRALGARRKDIQHQFLIEAVILTIVGGLMGTIVGIGATYGICLYTEWEFFVSSTSIPIGMGVSSVIGIFFGYQPARQAAGLDPIVALQGE